MTKKAKIGRRSPMGSYDRQQAQIWASTYRLAQSNPNGRHCVNPDAPEEERAFLYADNVDFLLELLENFAANGTFQFDSRDTNRLVFCMQYDLLRAAGKTREVAVESLAEIHNRSASSVNRTMQKPRRPRKLSKSDTD